MPKKGNGICQNHPKSSPACRACLMDGLREFRHANVQQGLRLASSRIGRLREKYISFQGIDVKSSTIVADLGGLIAELSAVEDRIADTVVDPAAIQHVLPSAVSK